MLTIYEIAKTVGYIMGPVLGGEILGAYDFGTMYACLAAFALLCAVLLLFLYEKRVTNIDTAEIRKHTITVSHERLLEIN